MIQKPDLTKAIEEELCPKCANDNNGSYNPVCARCDDFCNFKEKKNKND